MVGIYFEINGKQIKGIRRGDFKEGTRYIRTKDSKRSADGTGHMKLLSTKNVVILDLKSIASSLSCEIDEAINLNVDNATLKYFSFKKNKIIGEGKTFYVTDYDWTDAGTWNGVNHANATIEMIEN